MPAARSPRRTLATQLAELRPTLLAPSPPTRAQAARKREFVSARRALEAMGIPPELSAEPAKLAAPERRALMDAWTGRCQLTGIPFGTGPKAPAFIQGNLFVLHMVAQAKGSTPTPAFIAMCRRVVEHADRAPPPPAPQHQPSAQPRAARKPPAPIKQEQHHAADFDLRAPLGLQHPDDRPEDPHRPADGERPAGHGGGVWTWDAQRGCAVLGAA